MPRSEATPEQQRLAQIISRAKALDVYGLGDSWDEPDWNVTAVHQVTDTETSSHTSIRRLRLMFREHPARRGVPGAPFESMFADFAKTIVAARRHERAVGFSEQMSMVTTLRSLYEALRRTGTCDPTMITGAVFETATNAIQDRYNTAASIAHFATGLVEIGHFLDDYLLTAAPISWTGPPVPVRSGPGSGSGKMPPPEAMRALGELAHEDLSESDVILFRIIQLVIICGFRISEALTLPRDCWVERQFLDPVTGQIEVHHGIRYWPMKRGSTFIKWLPDVAVAVARTAVSDLERLCAKARQAAKRLEGCPDYVPLPGEHGVDDLLTKKDVREIIGVIDVNDYLRTHGVEPVRLVGDRAVRYRVGDVERALNSERPPLVIVRRGAHRQMLSESLGVAFKFQFVESTATNWALPELINDSKIRFALGVVEDKYDDLLRRFDDFVASSRAAGKRLPCKSDGTPHLTAIAKSIGIASTCFGQSRELRRRAYEAVGESPPTDFQDDLARSLFEKYGKTQPDGSPLRIRPHQLRHWVNTNAAQGGISGGMTIAEMALWFNRTSPSQTFAYLHLDTDERIAYLEREMEAGRIKGAFVEACATIRDPVERRQFIGIHAKAIHRTPYGLCLHDFDAQPCPFHLVCLKGCKMFLRERGNAQQQAAIRELLEFSDEQLVRMRRDGAAESWLAEEEKICDGCRKALAVDAGETGSLGEVFPEGRYLGRPAE